MRSRFSVFLTPPPGAAGVALILYCGAFAALRLATAPAIGVDADLEQLNAQLWAWGYASNQPPLYTWLLAALQSALGPTLGSALLLKYLALIGVVMGYAVLARRLLGSGFGVFAGLSLLTLWQIGWNLHEGVTHTLLLTLMCVVSALAWWRALEAPSLGRYAFLGVALGLGLLSKFGFGAFVFCLLAATLLQPVARHRARLDGLTLAALIALAVFSPYGLWLIESGGNPAELFAATMGTNDTAFYFERVAGGLVSGVTASIGFLMPFLAVILVAFPGIVRPFAATAATLGLDGQRFCRDAVLSGVVLMLIGVFFFGVAQFRERWLHPILILAPLWLLGRAANRLPMARQWRRFTLGAALIVALIFAGRAATNIVAAPLCGACRPLVPYSVLQEKIAQTGFRAGTIAAESSFTAANLRAAFPRSRALALDRPMLPRPPKAQAAENCLLVWQSGSATPPAELMSHIGLQELPETAEIREVAAPWPHLWRQTGWRVTRWRFVSFVPPADGHCPPLG